ncbi:hypothetical protein ACIPWI_19135 [Streptomyces sp. NPDC090046]|uniref:hypothetical protein n=1 Tax=Streptomyces sp. NPDC090046 TaxID=3365928 RepID=UPI003802D964
MRGRRGPDVRLAAQPTGPSMPHDLVHAAVESALGITDGFWGATAQGPRSKASNRSRRPATAAPG